MLSGTLSLQSLASEDVEIEADGEDGDEDALSNAGDVRSGEGAFSDGEMMLHHHHRHHSLAASLHTHHHHHHQIAGEEQELILKGEEKEEGKQALGEEEDPMDASPPHKSPSQSPNPTNPLASPSPREDNSPPNSTSASLFTTSPKRSPHHSPSHSERAEEEDIKGMVSPPLGLAKHHRCGSIITKDAYVVHSSYASFSYAKVHFILFLIITIMQRIE